MRTKKIAKYRNRKFLNSKFGMAAIQVDAYYNETEYAAKNDATPPSISRSMDIDVTISDCGGNINLDFHCYDEQKRKDRIRKINILISELEKVREVLEAGEVGERKGSWE